MTRTMITEKIDVDLKSGKGKEAQHTFSKVKELVEIVARQLHGVSFPSELKERMRQYHP